MQIVLLETDVLAPWFRRLGHDVLSIVWKRNRSSDATTFRANTPLYYRDLLIIFERYGVTPDLVLWQDVGNVPRVWGLEALECPTMGYFIDTFCNPWHIPYSACFDYVLAAQRNTLPFFEQDGLPRPAVWAPLFCNPDKDYHQEETRDIPVCFVGSLHPKQNPARYKFLTAFQKFCPIIIKQGDYRPLFARSRIVLNQSVAGEVNYRAFEAAACGAAVLNEDIDNGLFELFAPGETIITPYPRGDAAAAARIAKAALENPQELKRIARAGERLVLEEHSAPARCRQILEMCETVAEAPKKRLQNLTPLQTLMERACQFISGETDTILAAEHIAHFTMLAEKYAARWNKMSSLSQQKS